MLKKLSVISALAFLSSHSFADESKFNCKLDIDYFTDKPETFKNQTAIISILTKSSNKDIFLIKQDDLDILPLAISSIKVGDITELSNKTKNGIYDVSNKIVKDNGNEIESSIVLNTKNGNTMITQSIKSDPEHSYTLVAVGHCKKIKGI